MGKKAVYPGSFDPITNGHIDILERSTRMFDRVVLAILGNPAKDSVFPLAGRLRMARESVGDMAGVTVETFQGLLVDFLVQQKADVIIRGIRAVSDFEYEFQMAMMNRRLNSCIETVYLMPSESYFYLSSHLVHEVASLNGDVTGLVPAGVQKILEGKYGPGKGRK